MLTRFFLSLVAGTLYLAMLIIIATYFSDASALEHNQEPKVVTDYLDDWAAAQKFNGVIALKHGGEPLLTVAYGVAEASDDNPLTPNTVFQTGSIGKWFASIAVFALIEDDFLALHEPIGVYVNGLPPSIGQQVTLHHLMSNRSGLSDDALRAAMGSYIEAQMKGTLADLAVPETLGASVDALVAGELKFAPGAKFDYVNANWVMVKHVIEQATGKLYGDVLHERVFETAGMSSSGVFVNDLMNLDQHRAHIAIGFRDASEGFPGDYPLPAFIGGGSYTTVVDIAALQQSLDDGDSLTPMTIEKLRTVTTLEENYAYGGYIVKDEDRKYSWQSGSNGATNVVSIHPIDGNFTFVAASNTGHSQDTMFALGRDIEQGLEEGTLRLGRDAIAE